jgi:hypothetical protein
VVYNPLNQETERTLTLPLYYAGLTDIALVREQTSKPRKFRLDRQFNIHVPVKVPANGRTWLVIEGR